MRGVERVRAEVAESPLGVGNVDGVGGVDGLIRKR